MPAARWTCRSDARPGRLVDQGLAAVDRGGGVGQVVGDRLEGAERLAELRALLGVRRMVISRARSAPPMRLGGAAARSASCITCVLQVRQPGPGPRRCDSHAGTARLRPTRPGTGCPRRGICCWVSCHAGAWGSTRNSSTRPRPPRRCVPAPPDALRGAREMARAASVPGQHGISSPSDTARSCTPLEARSRRSGSTQAGVRMASPEAIFGSHSRFCSSVAAQPRAARRRRAPRSRSGVEGASERVRTPRRGPPPSSSEHLLRRAPRGCGSPSRPSSPSCFQNSLRVTGGIVSPSRERPRSGSARRTGTAHHLTQRLPALR